MTTTAAVTHDEPPIEDAETVARVPSGPAYSTFDPRTKKWITFMVSVASFVSPMTANIYYPVLEPIARDLDVTIALINLTVTSYMILQAISPTIFGDFGDMAGRRPAYLIAFAIYLCANIGLALQRNYVALLVLRMVQSGGSSGAIALGFAMVADITTSSERGKYMGIVGAGINIGPTLGPILGGVLTEFLGWSAIFWFCAILSVVWLVPFALVVPETCRNVVGNGSIAPQGWNKTLLDTLRTRGTPRQPTDPPRPRLRLPNPLRAVRIIFDREMALILFYNSILYVAFIDVSATLGTLFKRIYGFSDLELGLCYLTYGAGCCIASVAQGYILDWNYRRTARRVGFAIDRKRGDDLTHFPIERARLQPVFPTLAAGLAVLAVYGWVLHLETSVAVPLVLQFLIGLTITGSFGVMNTLIVDLNPKAPATATAANNLVRCLMGAAGTASIEYMIMGMGRGWSFTFLALLCAVLSPALWVIVRYGPEWRREKEARVTAAK
ncbi:MFS transporter R5 like protein [Verticillium longisporum]|uniref:MFS transporter R5 like protein n=2 Tax=Verticillium longisporum TaxID=100787 RepID=A0A8I2ZKH3_VERLO|nr:MFS transporter R5 like protein [Verticillium longisporum]